MLILNKKHQKSYNLRLLQKACYSDPKNTLNRHNRLLSLRHKNDDLQTETGSQIIKSISVDLIMDNTDILHKEESTCTKF